MRKDTRYSLNNLIAFLVNPLMAQTLYSQPLNGKTTEMLLARQAELIRSNQPIKPTFELPVYKSPKQIKAENKELRHTKSFMRVLKMH